MTITTSIRPVPAERPSPRRTRAPWFALIFLLVPTALHTQGQPTRSCPRFARVPGYGACSNIGGNSCGFCVYRCNDDTVVRWNVCAL